MTKITLEEFEKRAYEQIKDFCQEWESRHSHVVVNQGPLNAYPMELTESEWWDQFDEWFL